MVVGNMVDDLKRAAQDIIHHLGQTASVNSFQIRQRLLVTIGELEHAALTVRDKTFEHVDEQRQDLLQDAESTIAATKAATNGPLEKPGDVAKTVESAVARLPLADKSRAPPGSGRIACCRRPVARRCGPPHDARA